MTETSVGESPAGLWQDSAQRRPTRTHNHWVTS